jgi:hypothetical protein
MHAYSLLLALAIGTVEVREGTIVVLENSNFAVETYTKSETTHVGMLMYSEGELIVYEAAPKAVRKLKLDDYYQELSRLNRHKWEGHRLRLRLYPPKQPYSDKELAAIRAFLESQVGRRYSIKGYVRNKPNDGIHCADLVSTALVKTGRYRFDETYAVSPAALVEQVKATHDKPIDIDLPPYAKTGSWCTRSWSWWNGMCSWCSWACWETLTFAN